MTLKAQIIVAFVVVGMLGCLTDNPTNKKIGKIKKKTSFFSSIANPNQKSISSVELLDTVGNVTKEVEFSKTEDTLKITSYKYKEARLLEENVVDKEYKTEEKTVLDYNDKGQEIRRRFFYQPDVKQEDSTVNRFDEKGNIVQTIWYFQGDTSQIVLQKYDNSNNIVEKLITHTDYPAEWKYTYQNGLLKETKFINHKSKIEMVTKNIYNNRGNIIEQEKYFNGKTTPIFRINFEYEYYE